MVGDGEGGIKECWGEGSTSKLGRGFGWVLCWVHVSVKGTSHVHIANVGTAATLWPLTGGWLSVKLCQRAPHLIGRVVLLAPGGLGWAGFRLSGFRLACFLGFRLDFCGIPGWIWIWLGFGWISA